MYDRIVNPKTGRYVNTNGSLGKQILNNYIRQLGGSNRPIPDLCMKRTKKECKTHREGKSQCNWDSENRVCYSGKARQLTKSLVKSSKESTKEQRSFERKDRNRKHHKSSWTRSPITKAVMGATAMGMVTPGASAMYPYNSTHYLSSPIPLANTTSSEGFELQNNNTIGRYNIYDNWMTPGTGPYAGLIPKPPPTPPDLLLDQNNPGPMARDGTPLTSNVLVGEFGDDPLVQQRLNAWQLKF